MNASLHRLKLFSLIIIIFGSTRVSAQQEPWEIGLGVGYTNYYGDLSPYKIDGLRNLYRIADFNRHYQDRPSFSLMLHRKITPTLGFMVQANYLQFGMSDRYRNKSGNIDSTVGNYARALNFQTTVKDIGLAFTFNANNGKVFAKDAFFYPSFYLGAGVSQFTVKGDLYDANNNAYNYRLPGYINDGSFETNLRDQRTETDSRYPDIEPYVNLGLALNFRFSQRFSLAIQSDVKYSASDYLDDVSKVYKTTYTNPAEAYAARPGYNVVDPVTRVRGDNDGLNDFYVNNRIVLHVGLGGKKKPAPFVAPVIYTLTPPLRLSKVVVDSVRLRIVADSVAKIKADSLLKARVDSVKILQDSLISAASTTKLNDSLTRLQLVNITAELKEIKSALQTQRAEPRLSRIKAETDSIRALRQKITSQKKQSQEDNLRLRIYDFQLDSLNRESGNAGKSDKQVFADSVAIETPLESKEIREYSQEVAALKKDERYKTDTSFRNNVNVLQGRVDRYREQAKKDAAAEKSKGINNNQKIDSLQSRISFLESLAASKDSQSAQGRTDTVVKVDRSSAPRKTTEVRDTVARRRYEPVITDTVATRKKWYQRLFSTGPKEDKVDEERVVADTVTTKKKWYQRMFSTGPKEDKIEEKKVVEDTVTTRKKWYQRLFSTGNKGDDVTEERVLIDTVARSRPVPEEDRIIMDTVTRKKKWYQRIFSTGPKDTLRRSSANEAKPVTQEINYVQSTRGRPGTESENSTRAGSTIARDTVVVNRSAPRTTNTNVKKLAVVDPVTVRDTVELKRLMAESEQARRENEATVSQLRNQMKRSSDSAAFYRNALVQAAEIREANPETATRRSIFTNRRKQEEEARQREADEQAVRDQYLYQQRYQTSQVTQLQRRIDDLEGDNRSLSRYQDNYSTEIRRRNYVDVGTSSALVASSALSSSDSREMASMREELNRLKSQVNSQDQRLKSVDSLSARDSVQSVTPVAALPAPVVAGDTGRITALSSEIDLLRAEISRLKSAPAEVAKPEAPTAPDLKSFPVVSVYFNTNSILLTADQAAKLVPFAQAASTNKKAAILLKGFADATGNMAVNKKLALQRMESVKNLLLSKYQVSIYRISTDEPQIAGGAGNKKSNPLDRRVDLLFQ